MQPTGHPAAMKAHSLAGPSKGGRGGLDQLVAFSWNRWSPSPGTAGRLRWNAQCAEDIAAGPRRPANLLAAKHTTPDGPQWEFRDLDASPAAWPREHAALPGRARLPLSAARYSAGMNNQSGELCVLPQSPPNNQRTVAVIGSGNHRGFSDREGSFVTATEFSPVGHVARPDTFLVGDGLRRLNGQAPSHSLGRTIWAARRRTARSRRERGPLNAV